MRPLREQIFKIRGDRYNPPVDFIPVIKCYVDEEFSFDVRLLETPKKKGERCPFTRAASAFHFTESPSEKKVDTLLEEFGNRLVDAIEDAVGADGFLLYLTEPYSMVMHRPEDNEEKPWIVSLGAILCAGKVSF